MLKLPIINTREPHTSRNHKSTQNLIDSQQLRLNVKKFKFDALLDEGSSKNSAKTKSSTKGSTRSVKLIHTKSSKDGSTAAHSNRSSEFSEGFSEATSCFLKTKSNKFKKFSLAIEDGQLNFYKPSDPTDWERVSHDRPRASHQLNKFHVMYGAIEKCPDTKQYFYPVKLSFADSYCRR